MRILPVLSADEAQQLRELEDSYLSYSDPLRQSGYHGGLSNWQKKRGIVLEAVARDGSFLDVGCANGYLLECLVTWAAERGVQLTPYGLDIGARLIALARQRLPHWADQFFGGNIWAWTPPRKFDYVSTSIVVPDVYRRACFDHLVTQVVAPGGRLIVRNYYNDADDRARGDVTAFLQAEGIRIAGSIVSEPPGADYVWIDC